MLSCPTCLVRKSRIRLTFTVQGLFTLNRSGTSKWRLWRTRKLPNYDATRFQPPAPVAYVTLRNSETAVSQTDVPMLIDSGADITLIPQAPLLSLGLNAASETFYELKAFDGSISVAPVVQLDLILEGRSFRGRFLVLD